MIKRSYRLGTGVVETSDRDALRLAGTVTTNRTALIFGEPAPNAGVLRGVQRPLEARLLHRAHRADGFRGFDLCQSRAGRPDREKELWVDVPARSLVAPIHRELVQNLASQVRLCERFLGPQRREYIPRVFDLAIPSGWKNRGLDLLIRGGE
jgi:hypothetical protein